MHHHAADEHSCTGTDTSTSGQQLAGVGGFIRRAVSDRHSATHGTPTLLRSLSCGSATAMPTNSLPCISAQQSLPASTEAALRQQPASTSCQSDTTRSQSSPGALGHRQLHIELPTRHTSLGEWGSQGWVHASTSSTAVDALSIPSGIAQLSADELTRHCELGRGFFGRVSLASWRGRHVAVKEALGDGGRPSAWTSCSDDSAFGCSGSSSDCAASAAVLAEARTLVQLHHPDHVVGLVGLVAEPGCYALVMEHMASGSLREALPRLHARGLGRGSEGLKFKAAVAAAAARGLAHVHACGYVHFDVKLDNLLCDLRTPEQPVVKVGDVGLCEALQGESLPSGPRGTTLFMAPEMFCSSTAPGGATGGDQAGCTSNSITEKVDVYSFGMSLLEIWSMCSRPLYPETLSSSEVMAGVLTGSLRPDIPDDVDQRWAELVERCWSAEPSSRPSFAQLANELQVLAHQQ